jgi:hypothetical protein
MANIYISPSRTFSFDYPDTWKLERPGDGFIVLRKKGGMLKRESTCSLRIKSLVSDRIISREAFKSYVDMRKKEHRDLKLDDRPDSYIMNFNVLTYRQEGFRDTPEKTIRIVQDCWELIVNNRIFQCFFSVDKGEEDTPRAVEERETAEQILHSLQLL